MTLGALLGFAFGGLEIILRIMLSKDRLRDDNYYPLTAKKYTTYISCRQVLYVCEIESKVCDPINPSILYIRAIYLSESGLRLSMLVLNSILYASLTISLFHLTGDQLISGDNRIFWNRHHLSTLGSLDVYLLRLLCTNGSLWESLE